MLFNIFAFYSDSFIFETFPDDLGPIADETMMKRWRKRFENERTMHFEIVSSKMT